ncbi:MAG: DUF503 domain-containing protein [Chloroflexi bacterium]|nr:DUF503 domain-containing protein [Chloroflexota bacterium]
MRTRFFLAIPDRQAAASLARIIRKEYSEIVAIMQVGVARIRFRIPENASLKGKRQIVRPIIARIGNKFSVAVAEVDDNDLWQVATLGISCVSNDKRQANEVLSKVVEFVANGRFDIEMLDYEIEIIPVLGDQENLSNFPPSE